MAEIDYAVCPVCGRNRVIESHDKGRIRWNYITDLGADVFIQIRAGGGKVSVVGPGERRPHRKVVGREPSPGVGFPLVRSLTLPEVMDDPAYADVVQGLRDQLVLLVKDGVKLGLIKKEELE